MALLADGKYVAKVDQGVKKRFINGLVVTGVTPREAAAKIAEWQKKGYTRFLIEPMVAHEPGDERYVSFERMRDGIRVLFSKAGGVAVEEGAIVESYRIPYTEAAPTLPVPSALVSRIQTLMNDAHVSFVEINPFIIKDGTPILLDAAVMVDGAGQFFTGAYWSSDDIVERPVGEYEAAVRTLQESTPASLKLSIINPDGALFFLLSGGGGSIVVLDEVHHQGGAALIGNYGEYSGNPTREETHLYTREVVRALLVSRAPKRALVIAGGVANFTDIQKTFAGVIDAIAECASELRAGKIKVYVRRGGPNEGAGLAHMKAFLAKEDLLGAVYGSEASITRAASDAVAAITHA